jgi:hypothetical protein
MTWYRVFGLLEEPPDLNSLLAALRHTFPGLEARHQAVPSGWAECVLHLPNVPFRCFLSRYSQADDIRAELQGWAAWLESLNESDCLHQQLMELLMTTQQAFALYGEPEDQDPGLTELTARYLARCTKGVYHREGRGFFDAEGRLLIPDPPSDSVEC